MNPRLQTVASQMGSVSLAFEAFAPRRLFGPSNSLVLPGIFT